MHNCPQLGATRLIVIQGCLSGVENKGFMNQSGWYLGICRLHWHCVMEDHNDVSCWSKSDVDQGMKESWRFNKIKGKEP